MLGTEVPTFLFVPAILCMYTSVKFKVPTWLFVLTMLNPKSIALTTRYPI